MKSSAFKEIQIEKPVDKIISQIKQLISTGQLQPGDRLPPERQLAESMAVGRSHVREAIRKLEFYGILKTLPQSGTVVAGLGIKALEGLITNILQIENNDFHSLVETRVILEANAVMLAAQHRTDEDIQDLEASFELYKFKVLKGEPGLDEDLMFHLKIAEASRNSVLKSLIMIVIPDILTYFIQSSFCKDGRFYKALEGHRIILDLIKQQKPQEVQAAMKAHLHDILEHSLNEKSKTNFHLP